MATAHARAAEANAPKRRGHAHPRIHLGSEKVHRGWPDEKDTARFGYNVDDSIPLMFR